MADTRTMSPPKFATEQSQLLGISLRRMDKSLRSVNMTIELLAPGPDVDNCLILQLEDQVSCLRAELLDVTHDIL